MYDLDALDVVAEGESVELVGDARPNVDARRVEVAGDEDHGRHLARLGAEHEFAQRVDRDEPRPGMHGHAVVAGRAKDLLDGAGRLDDHLDVDGLAVLAVEPVLRRRLAHLGEERLGVVADDRDRRLGSAVADRLPRNEPGAPAAHEIVADPLVVGFDGLPATHEPVKHLPRRDRPVVGVVVEHREDLLERLARRRPRRSTARSRPAATACSGLP